MSCNIGVLVCKGHGSLVFVHFISRFSPTEGQRDPVMKRKKKSKHVGNKRVPVSTVGTGKRSLLPWMKLMMRRRNFFR